MFKRAIAIVAAITLSLGLAGAVRAQDQDQGGKKQEMPKRNPNAGFFGAKLAPIDDDKKEELKLDSTNGIVIIQILPDSPAAKAGLKEDDVIRKVDDKAVDEVGDFVSHMEKSKPGQDMKFSIIRGGEEKDVTVTLGKRPANFGEQPRDKGPTTNPDKKD